MLNREWPVFSACHVISPRKESSCLSSLAEKKSTTPIGSVSDLQRPIAVVESETNPSFALKSGPSVGKRAFAVVMHFPCFVTVQHIPSSCTSYVLHFLCPLSSILELIAISVHVLIFGSFRCSMVTVWSRLSHRVCSPQIGCLPLHHHCHRSALLDTFLQPTVLQHFVWRSVC